MKRRGLIVLVALAATVPMASSADGSLTKKQRQEAAQANTQLAIAYMREGDLATAREKLEKALDQYPNTAATQMTAGFLYDKLGDDKKAEAYFEHAVKLGKDDPDVLNNFAVFLCRKGDKKRGESYFLQAAKNPLYRTPEVAYANAGRCARADGRPEEAEKYFREALTFKSDQLDSLYEMADLEHELGHDLQARAFLERYASVAPPSAVSLWLGYRIERALGDYEHAKVYAERIKKDFATSKEMSLLVEAERAQQ
jgi:type IV pilus assembly protein PilF